MMTFADYTHRRLDEMTSERKSRVAMNAVAIQQAEEAVENKLLPLIEASRAAYLDALTQAARFEMFELLVEAIRAETQNFAWRGECANSITITFFQYPLNIHSKLLRPVSLEKLFVVMSHGEEMARMLRGLLQPYVADGILPQALRIEADPNPEMGLNGYPEDNWRYVITFPYPI